MLLLAHLRVSARWPASPEVMHLLMMQYMYYMAPAVVSS